MASKLGHLTAVDRGSGSGQKLVQITGSNRLKPHIKAVLTTT